MRGSVQIIVHATAITNILPGRVMPVVQGEALVTTSAVVCNNIPRKSLKRSCVKQIASIPRKSSRVKARMTINKFKAGMLVHALTERGEYAPATIEHINASNNTMVLKWASGNRDDTEKQINEVALLRAI
eukprot:510516-Rhodomonas_salina.2